MKKHTTDLTQTVGNGEPPGYPFPRLDGTIRTGRREVSIST